MATDGHLDIYHAAAVHMMDKLEKIIHLPWESFRCPKTKLVPRRQYILRVDKEEEEELVFA